MEIVKKYISPCDYKNCILVNKEWKSNFLEINHLIKLHYKLKNGSFFSKFTQDVIKKKQLSILEILKCLLEELSDEPKKNYEYRQLKFKPFNFITCLKIKKNPRLNYINLLGY